MENLAFLPSYPLRLSDIAVDFNAHLTLGAMPYMLSSMQKWTSSRVRALRNALGENTHAFAERFARSSRTVEDWESGRRNPDPLCQRMMDVIAVQIPVDTLRDIAV